MIHEPSMDTTLFWNEEQGMRSSAMETLHPYDGLEVINQFSI